MNCYNKHQLIVAMSHKRRNYSAIFNGLSKLTFWKFMRATDRFSDIFMILKIIQILFVLIRLCIYSVNNSITTTDRVTFIPQKSIRLYYSQMYVLRYEFSQNFALEIKCYHFLPGCHVISYVYRALEEGE